MGPDIINTIPLPTLNAFLDHGQIRTSLLENVEEAKADLSSMKKFDIDLKAVTDQLLKEGVQSFVQAYDRMLDSLKGRCEIK